MAIQPAKLSFTIFLGALAALPPLSIDMGLPAFPQVEAQLGASASEVTQTLSLFLLGFATGPLLLGPLSDRFGRRPILLTGLVIFVLAGLGCALATDLRMLLGFRLLQGIGAGAGATLPFAIVRDLFDGVQARMRMSAVTLVLGVGPIIAPLLGASLLMIGDWRLIYAALALGGLLLLAITGFGFRESSPEGKHHSVSPRRMLSSYGHVLSNRTFLGNSWRLLGHVRLHLGVAFGPDGQPRCVQQHLQLPFRLLRRGFRAGLSAERHLGGAAGVRASDRTGSECLPGDRLGRHRSAHPDRDPAAGEPCCAGRAQHLWMRAVGAPCGA
jgi:multidrug resistance protein